MSPCDKIVYIKTYKTYFHDNKTMFVGARSTEIIDFIYGFDFLNHPFRNEDKSTIKYIESAYCFSEPVYDGNDSDKYDREYSFCKQKKYFLRSNISLEEKCYIYRIVINNLKNFKLYENIEDYETYKDKSLYNRFKKISILLPDVSNLKNVQKGRYLDIFWRPSEKEVRLRAEYYYDGKNWKEISVINLSDKRKVQNSSNGEYISIPSDKTCYFMLSDIKQSAKRLEEIREKIQNRKAINWAEINKDLSNTFIYSLENNSISTKPEVVMRSASFQDNRLRVIEIPPLNNSNTKETISKYIGYENVTFENDSSIPIIIVPDYAEYAENLFNELDKHYTEYLKLTGTNPEQINNATGKSNPISEELIQKQNDNLLKYLSEIVCDNNNKWDLLLNEKKEYNKSLKQNLFEIRSHYSFFIYCARKLSWWISQTPYQEMLYDYDYYYYYVDRNKKKQEEIVFEHFIKYLAILENINVANDALLYLYEDARSKAFTIFHNLNPNSTYSDFQQYLLGKQKNIKDELELFQCCKTIVNENWVTDIFFKKVKDFCNDYYFDVLATLSHIVIISEGKKYNKIEDLFNLYYQFCLKIDYEKLKDIPLIRSSINNQKINVTFNNGITSIDVFYFGEKNENESIVSNIIKFGPSIYLKHAINAFDRCIAIYQLSKTKDGNEYIKVFNSVIGDLLELSGYNDSIKNTKLGKIKVNGNTLFSKYSGLVSFGADVLGFMYYLSEGDTAYALADFTCDVIFLLLTTAFTGIFFGIIFFLSKAILNQAIEKLKTDDFEKWVLCNNYGKYNDNLLNQNAWKNKIYLSYVLDSRNEYDKLDTKSQEEKRKKDTTNWKKNISEQIKTYYKIEFDMSFELNPYRLLPHDFIPMQDLEDGYESFNMLRIDISTKFFYPKDKVILHFTISKNNKVFTIPVDTENINVFFDSKKGGYKLVIILATDIYRITKLIKEEIVQDFNKLTNKPETIKIVNSKESKNFLNVCNTGVFRFDSPIYYSVEYYSTYYTDCEKPFLVKEDFYFNSLRCINCWEQ